MLRFFLFLGDYSENLIPDTCISTFFKIYFGLSETSKSNEGEIGSVSRCHHPHTCNQTRGSVRPQGVEDPSRSTPIARHRRAWLWTPVPAPFQTRLPWRRSGYGDDSSAPLPPETHRSPWLRVGPSKAAPRRLPLPPRRHSSRSCHGGAALGPPAPQRPPGRSARAPTARPRRGGRRPGWPGRPSRPRGAARLAPLCHPCSKTGLESCFDHSAVGLPPWGAGRRGESRAGRRAGPPSLPRRGARRERREVSRGERGRKSQGRTKRGTARSPIVLLSELLAEKSTRGRSFPLLCGAPRVSQRRPALPPRSAGCKRGFLRRGGPPAGQRRRGGGSAGPGGGSAGSGQEPARDSRSQPTARPRLSVRRRRPLREEGAAARGLGKVSRAEEGPCPPAGAGPARQRFGGRGEGRGGRPPSQPWGLP